MQSSQLTENLQLKIQLKLNRELNLYLFAFINFRAAFKSVL